MSVEVRASQAAVPSGFRRVVCGIDGTPESLEASRQAAAVAASKSCLELVGVYDPGEAMLAGVHAARVERDLVSGAEQALIRAQSECLEASVTLLGGRPRVTLLGVARERGADLVAVGWHGNSRISGITLGSVATAAIHEAPCSVLVSRMSVAGEFPRSIVVATDGSDGADRAVDVAAAIGRRHDSRIALLHVADDRAGESIAAEAGRTIEATGQEPWIEVREGSAKREIPRFADVCHASLIVIGSRGLGGLRTLGSVSEVVAHRAPCSVLIVRSAHTEEVG